MGNALLKGVPVRAALTVIQASVKNNVRHNLVLHIYRPELSEIAVLRAEDTADRRRRGRAVRRVGQQAVLDLGGILGVSEALAHVLRGAAAEAARASEVRKGGAGSQIWLTVGVGVERRALRCSPRRR